MGNKKKNIEISGVSEFKKSLLAGKRNGEAIYDDYSAVDFAKNLILSSEGQVELRQKVAYEIAYHLIKNLGISEYKKDYEKLIEDEEKRFKEEKANFEKNKTAKSNEQNTIFDNHGGSRASMKDRYLLEKSYELFKKQIVEFQFDEFTINKNSDIKKKDEMSINSFINKYSQITKEDISDSKNWSKIHFHPKIKKSYIEETLERKNYLFGRSHFLNWAYKHWYKDNVPVYVWMSLWKYDESGSYKNPSFSSTTKSKFKSFLSKMDSFTDSTTKLTSVPIQYTDDSSTLILVEGKNSHKSLYVEFANASHYLMNKTITDSKNVDCESVLFESATSTPAIKSIQKSTITSKQSPDEVISINGSNYDSVDISDNQWLFLKNVSGVHAINLDGSAKIKDSTNGCKFKTLFEIFKFRELQLINRNSLNISEIPDLTNNLGLNKFKNYLSNNFDLLFTKYFYEKSNTKKHLFSSLAREKKDHFKKYEKLIKSINSLNYLKSKYQSIHDIREKTISHYVKDRKWDFQSNDAKFSKKSTGYEKSGSFPYIIEKTQGKKMLFPEQEKLLYYYQEEQEKNLDILLSKYIEKFSQYETAVEEIFNDWKLSIETKNHEFLKSDRVFLNNLIFNYVFDLLLEKKTLVEKTIKKNIFSQGYSYIGAIQRTKLVDKNLIPTSSNVTSQTSSENLNFYKETEITKNFLENLKENYLNNLSFKYGNNLFSPLVFDVLKDQEKISETKTQLLSSSVDTFKKEFFLLNDNYENEWIEFLITISYLMKKDAENVRNYLKNIVSPETETYFIYRKIETKDESALSVTINPYLGNYDSNEDTNKKFTYKNEEEKEDSFDYFDSLEIKKSGSSATSSTSSSSSSSSTNSSQERYKFLAVQDLSKDSNKPTANDFFSFESKEKLIEYIREIESSQKFESLLSKIKTVFADKSTELSKVSLDTVTGPDNKTFQLSLINKKNALIAFILKHKLSDISETLDKEKLKRFFGWDQENKSNELFDSKTPNGSETDSFSGKFNRISSEANKKYYIPINRADFETREKFIQFLTTNLNQKMYIKLLFWLSKNEEIINIAKQDFLRARNKINIYDKKLQEIVDMNFSNT